MNDRSSYKSTEHLEKYKEEYKQIQERRKLFSGLIMDWLKLMIPIGGVLYVFSDYLVLIPKCCPNQFLLCFLPYLGWLLFVVPLFTWRIVARHISRQITVMYPRLLELERELKWEVDTVYILNNLSRWGWQELSEILKHTPAPCGQPERRNYLQYKESCRNNGIDVYAPLLMVWNELGYESVGSRGHTVQDIMVAIVSVATLAISSFIAIQNYLCYPCVIIISSVLFIGVIIVLLNLIVPRCHWN